MSHEFVIAHHKCPEGQVRPRLWTPIGARAAYIWTLSQTMCLWNIASNGHFFLARIYFLTCGLKSYLVPPLLMSRIYLLPLAAISKSTEPLSGLMRNTLSQVWESVRLDAQPDQPRILGE